MRKIAILILLFFSFTAHAIAVNPDEVLQNPVLEQRARALSAGVRCLVCQNQSIDDSDAQLASDLRILIREKLVEGLTDDQILAFLVDRYGEFVLLKPRFNAHTLLLWILPLLALLIGIVFAIRTLNRTKTIEATQSSALSEAEKEKLDNILHQ